MAVSLAPWDGHYLSGKRSSIAVGSGGSISKAQPSLPVIICGQSAMDTWNQSIINSLGWGICRHHVLTGTWKTYRLGTEKLIRIRHSNQLDDQIYTIFSFSRNNWHLNHGLSPLMYWTLPVKRMNALKLAECIMESLHNVLGSMPFKHKLRKLIL